MKKIFFFLAVSLISVSCFGSPKAVVFDFGGVMTKTGSLDQKSIVKFIKESFSLSEEEFETLASKEEKIDLRFWIGYAQEKKLPENWEDSFRTVVKKAIGINFEMYDLIEELKKKKIQVSMLSNNGRRFSKLMREFDLYSPFEPCLLGYEIKAKKPRDKAFEVLLSKLEFPAQEVIFVDDKQANILAAKKLGFDAILFKSEKQIRKELKKRNAL